MEINLPCVVIAPNKKKVYKSFIGCQERILSCRVLFHTVKTRFQKDPRSKRTLHYYGQFALSLGKESPYILFKFNPLNTDAFYGPFSVRTNGVWLSFVLRIVLGRWLCRVHCITWPYELFQFSGTLLFHNCTTRLTLKHIQLVTYPENQIVNLE